MRICYRCKKEKPLGDFAKCRKRADGLQVSCRACTSAYNREWYARNKDRRSTTQKTWYQENKQRHSAAVAANKRANPEHYRKLSTDLARLKRYGLTKERFAEMLEQQAGACAICQARFSSEPHVDHCHSTKVVRGLLCGQCNRALGLLKDDPARIRRAAQYLEANRP